MSAENQNQGGKKRTLSHKRWKALWKKEKRRAQRQVRAQLREAQQQREQAELEKMPGYWEQKAREEQQEQLVLQWQQKEQERLNCLWEEREQLAQVKWRAAQERKEREKQRREEDEARIKAEWEERLKKEKEEEEARRKEEEERKNKQDALLQEARAHERTEGDEEWHNPIAPPNYGKEKEKCGFYMKVGVCRFGDRCSRYHPPPESSRTLLFPGMYTHFELHQGLDEEFDLDVNLEYEDKELYQQFRNFYFDVLPEFKKYGKVIQFKVSCNYEPHLRGNVYVQYEREEDAQEAFLKFNGRFYAGRRLQCEFCVVDQWKAAICGLFHQKKCPKGKNCNFLHVFRNPSNEFWEADRDYQLRFSERNTGRYSSRDSRRHRSVQHRTRSRSRSPRHRRGRRSRSRSPRHRKSRSRSPRHRKARFRSPSDRKSSRTPRHRKSRSRSPRHRKSQSRSPKSERSRTRSPEQRQSISPKGGTESPNQEADPPKYAGPRSPSNRDTGPRSPEPVSRSGSYQRSPPRDVNGENGSSYRQNSDSRERDLGMDSHRNRSRSVSDSDSSDSESVESTKKSHKSKKSKHRKKRKKKKHKKEKLNAKRTRGLEGQSGESGQDSVPDEEQGDSDDVGKAQHLQPPTGSVLS